MERVFTQNVTRGENKEKLSHDNVVRSFQSRQFDGKQNQFKLEIPSDLNSKKSSVIIYAQIESAWEVIGAKKILYN